MERRLRLGYWHNVSRVQPPLHTHLPLIAMAFAYSNPCTAKSEQPMPHSQPRVPVPHDCEPQRRTNCTSIVSEIFVIWHCLQVFTHQSETDPSARRPLKAGLQSESIYQVHRGHLTGSCKARQTSIRVWNFGYSLLLLVHCQQEGLIVRTNFIFLELDAFPSH